MMKKLELITFKTTMEEFEPDLYNNLYNLCPDESEEATEKGFENNMDMIIEEARFESTTMQMDWIEEYTFILEKVIDRIHDYMKDSFSEITSSLTAIEEDGDYNFVISVASVRY